MKLPEIPALIAMDLDGTILPPGGSISAADLKALGVCRSAGIVTALVTGRSMFSLRRSLSGGIPVDYIVFSTGAGLWDNDTSELLQARNLAPDETSAIIDALYSIGVDFMIQHALPDNHHFTYHTSGQPGGDFLRRLAIYEGYHDVIQISEPHAFEASQAIVILPISQESTLQDLKLALPDFKVVRTTSPIDHESIWVEVFPAGVSKGHGLQGLCDRIGIDIPHVLALGNDFNDLDMLEIAGYPFVVDTSPQELKDSYPSVPSVSPLAHVIGMAGLRV